MRSALAKVLHPLAGVPMTEHVVRSARAVHPGQIILTIGPTSEQLRTIISGVEFAWQPEALGTANATAVALPLLHPSITRVAVILGDQPLLDVDTLRQLVDAAAQNGAIATFLAIELDDPGPYGRFIRRDGRIVEIVEARDDINIHDQPVLCNSGLACFQRSWLEEHIHQTTINPNGEYYLTELVKLADATVPAGEPVRVVVAPEEVALGINDRAELAHAERIIRARINTGHMRAGVTLVDPHTTYIDADVVIGPDTRIEPGCVLKGRTTVGRGTLIGPNSVLDDARIGDHATILASWIESSIVGNGTRVGPFSHLRPGTVLAADVHIGNYAELKNSSVGTGTHIGHFSYIGDAQLGERVNIGAGVVTVNYDGRDKHPTSIGDDAFIGSDTMLVAPASVGDGGRTGAGSVVTKPVEAGALVVGVPARRVPTRDGAAPTAGTRLQDEDQH
jgi:bifunctional UDP-N-acetylglucosamine pyrophosphorylase/glucosamine-1-phosphate N-acetyltransferase